MNIKTWIHIVRWDSLEEIWGKWRWQRDKYVRLYIVTSTLLESAVVQ